MSQDRHVPDWELAMLRLGELPPDRAAALRERMARDPELTARFDALDQREAELMERLPPRVLAAAVAERAAPAPARRRRWLWWAVELAAVALLLVLVLPPLFGPEQLDVVTEHGTRDKGVEAHLRVFRQVDGGLEELDIHDPLHAGERLQISYVSLGARYGAVLSIDGRGAVTWHLPMGGGEAVELDPEGTVELPASYQLDDAPRFERFVLITAQEPFELAPVLAAAQELAATPDRAIDAPLALPRGLDQADFAIDKEPSP